MLARGPTDALPDVARAPLQPPEAVQAEALVEDQVSVEAPFTVTDGGFAVRFTVGAGGGDGAFTVTLTLRCALPPAPVQSSVKAVLEFNGPTDWLPDVGRTPLHPPDAIHAEALVDDHDSVELPPVETAVGLALNVTVGAGDGALFTVTVTLCCAEPPPPVQLRM